MKKRVACQAGVFETKLSAVYCCTDGGRHLESSQPFPRGTATSKLTGEHYCPEIASSVHTALQSGGLSKMQLKRCEKKSIIPFDFTITRHLA